MDTAVAVIDQPQSVAALYASEADRLWHALYAYSGDSDIASDAVAEAYAQLIARGDAVRDPAAWTWRVAFRIAAGSLKGRRASRPAERGSATAEDRYANVDLLAALGRLADGQRAAVVLHYYADMPVAEIARRLGSNSLAVRANLSRGRRRLRELLGDNHG